jgi:hypothetical protein
MFDQLAKALKEKKVMPYGKDYPEKKQKKEPLSHIGGEVEPGTNELEIDEVDLTKRYPKWEEGYERGEVQPSFPKVPMNDREG